MTRQWNYQFASMWPLKWKTTVLVLINRNHSRHVFRPGRSVCLSACLSVCLSCVLSIFSLLTHFQYRVDQERRRCNCLPCARSGRSKSFAFSPSSSTAAQISPSDKIPPVNAEQPELFTDRWIDWSIDRLRLRDLWIDWLRKWWVVKSIDWWIDWMIE